MFKEKRKALAERKKRLENTKKEILRIQEELRLSCKHEIVIELKGHAGTPRGSDRKACCVCGAVEERWGRQEYLILKNRPVKIFFYDEHGLVDPKSQKRSKYIFALGCYDKTFDEILEYLLSLPAESIVDVLNTGQFL